MDDRYYLEKELSFIIGDKPTLEEKMNALDNALYMIYNPTYKNNIAYKAYGGNPDSDVLYWERCYSQRTNIDRLLEIYRKLKEQ